KTDPEAFGALYDRYFAQIYRFVFSRLRDQTAAEDVTSEVFMKALRSIPRYQDTGRPFTAWLYQISVNTVNDRFRASRPTVDLEGLFGDDPELPRIARRLQGSRLRPPPLGPGFRHSLRRELMKQAYDRYQRGSRPSFLAGLFSGPRLAMAGALVGVVLVGLLV